LVIAKNDGPGAADPDQSGADGVTLGVEEEFLLVDPVSFRVVPRASELMSAVRAPLRPYLRHELLETQIEIATPVCQDLAELRSSLTLLRRTVQQAARQVGCRIMAAGTGIMPCPEPPPLVMGRRYARIAGAVGDLVAVPGLSACHVHVGVADRDRAVDVLNRIRPHLPVLQALGANSAVAEGRDTGYGSWRSIQVRRWPASGPPPRLDSADQFDELTARLRSAGVILDPGMLYWYARPSATYPTVELRASDVCLTIDDAVLMAALSRALVRTALQDEGRKPVPECDEHLLDAAHWRAAKEGLEGAAIDPLRGQVVPAWDLVDRLVAHVRPALTDRGDLDTVCKELGRLRRDGSGAARQRRVLAERRDVQEVARYVVTQSEVADPR
jgi:carboxylate-amine ligase